MKIKKLYLGLLIITASLFFPFLITHALVSASTPASPDAVAIRVLPNPNWLSASEWYAAQGYTGSPQSMVVDGYDAIRDNRTVYVAALNTASDDSVGYCANDANRTCNPLATGMGYYGQCWGGNTFGNCDYNTRKCSGDKSVSCNPIDAPFVCGIYYGPCQEKVTAYDNIYVITYNEGADNNTVDIFGKILSAWKFNNNMSGSGHCFSLTQTVEAISTSSQVITDNLTGATSTVIVTSNPAITGCRLDSDCPTQYFCDFGRAKLLRDEKRIASFMNIYNALNTYKNTNGHFPLIEAGSYLKNATISTWPSWTNIFSAQLGVNELDPINTLGACPGYEASTCWDALNYKYYNNGTASDLTLPASSSAIVYTVDPKTSAYSLCFNREFPFMAVGGDASTMTLINSIKNCNTNHIGSGAVNLAPKFTTPTSFTVAADKKLLGYIKMVDPESDPISFSFVPNSSYTDISVVSTNDPNQLKIFASTTYAVDGVVGKLTISDDHGNSTSTDISVKFGGATLKPVITAPDVDYYLSAKPENAFDYTATIVAPLNSLNSSGSVGFSGYGFSSLIFIGAEYNFSSGYLQGLKYKFENIGSDQASGLNQYRFKLYGNIASNAVNSPAVDNNKVYTLTVGSVSKNFTIHFHANAPQLSMQCNKQSAIFNTYNCQLDNTNSNNAGITYSVLSNPAGKFSFADPTVGLLTGMVNTSSTIPFTVTAANEYGATSSISSVASSDVTGVKYSCGMLKYDGGPWNETGNIRNQEGYYRTIKLGDRCWLADNLNATSLGTCYGGVSTNCDAYGQLYYGADVTDNLCPSGWHIPNGNDFNLLYNSVATDTQVLGINGISGFDVNYAGANFSKVNCTAATSLTLGSCEQLGYGYYDLSDYGYYWASNIGYIPPSASGGIAKRTYFSFSSSSSILSSSTAPYRYDNNTTNPFSQYSLRCVQDLSCDSSCSTGQYCDKYSGTCKSQCGDGLVESGEVCDNGSSDNAGLNGVGVYSPLSNPFNPKGFCNATCGGYDHFCGDNSAQTAEGEVCDGLSMTCNKWFNLSKGYSGSIPCSSDCSAYNFTTKQCVININEWINAPSETIACVGRPCLVRLNSDTTCTNQAETLDISKAEWYKGVITSKGGTTICSVAGKCTDMINLNKCRYLNNKWSGQCFVHSDASMNPGNCPNQ